MNTIRMTGQAITGTNYATDRIFNFNPEPVAAMAEAFLAGGVTEVEIPQAVLDPDKRCSERGIDEERLAATLAGLPGETKVIGTYLSSFTLGEDNGAYLAQQKRALSHLIENFPDLGYAVLHPARQLAEGVGISHIVDAYARLAEHAESLRPGFQLCFHNHFDTTGETAEEVLEYLGAIEAVGLPSLTWGPDTGHSDGMQDRTIEVFERYAHLIRDFFHIKARVPAFDQQHGSSYDEGRDIWSDSAEIGSGLYGGFVNVADPEIATPLGELFRIIREKARPASGVVRGAVEIDNPRQHPRLEVLCAVLYLKNVHSIEAGLSLTNDQIVQRVFT